MFYSGVRIVSSCLIPLLFGQLEEFCISAIIKVKDAFGWSGDIQKEDGIGVWTGKLPAYMRTLRAAKSDGEIVSTVSTSDKMDAGDAEVSLQDVASYQVYFSIQLFSSVCERRAVYTLLRKLQLASMKLRNIGQTRMRIGKIIYQIKK